MDSINDATRGRDFVVVRFPREKDSDGNVLVDLVLRSWLILENDELKSYYPPHDDYGCVKQLVRTKTPVKSTWKSYPAEIVATSESYKGARKKLKKSYTHTTVESTGESDNGSKKNVTQPPLSKTEAKNALQSITEENESMAENSAPKRKRNDSTSSSEDDDLKQFPPAKKSRINSTDSCNTLMATPGSSRTIEQPGTALPATLLASETSEDDNSGTETDSDDVEDVEPNAKNPTEHKDIEQGVNGPQAIQQEAIQQQEGASNQAAIVNGVDAQEIYINEMPIILENIPIVNNHEPMLQRFAEMLEKFKLEIIQAVQDIVTKSVENSKRSLQYDMNKRLSRLSNNLVLNHGVARNRLPDLNTLGIVMPAESLENFLALENLIQNQEEKQQLVDEFISSKIREYPKELVKQGISAALGSFLGKNVQLMYSGKGKRIKNQQKRNFSETNLYCRLKGVIYSLHEIEDNKIIKMVSTWLAGAKDRDGGRKVRALENQDHNP